MALKDEIQLLNINAVALRKAADEHLRKMEEVKKKSAQPSSGVRQNHKTKRIERAALFYTKRKLKKAV